METNMLETLLQNEYIYIYIKARMRLLVERGRQAPKKFVGEMFFVLMQEKAKEICCRNYLRHYLHLHLHLHLPSPDEVLMGID